MISEWERSDEPTVPADWLNYCMNASRDPPTPNSPSNYCTVGPGSGSVDRQVVVPDFNEVYRTFLYELCTLPAVLRSGVSLARGSSITAFGVVAVHT